MDGQRGENGRFERGLPAQDTHGAHLARHRWRAERRPLRGRQGAVERLPTGEQVDILESFFLTLKLNFVSGST